MIKSQMESASGRFVSECLSYSLDHGWLTAGQLIGEFSLTGLLEALSRSPEVRADLLVNATGIHRAIARKKSSSGGAEDLCLALEEDVCDADYLVHMISPDCYVEHLTPVAVWELLTRDKFWFKDTPRSRERLLFTAQVGLALDLVSTQKFMRAIGPEALISRLSRGLLEETVLRSISLGRQGRALTSQELFDIVPVGAWIEHGELEYLWDTLIVDELATRAGLVVLEPSSTLGLSQELNLENVAVRQPRSAPPPLPSMPVKAVEVPKPMVAQHSRPPTPPSQRPPQERPLRLVSSVMPPPSSAKARPVGRQDTIMGQAPPPPQQMDSSIAKEESGTHSTLPESQIYSRDEYGRRLEEEMATWRPPHYLQKKA